MPATVFEEAGYFRLGPGVRVAASAVRVQTSRSGGPGGQRVNKLSTAVEIWVPITAIEGLDESAQVRLRMLGASRMTKEDELHLRAEDTRSQRDNRQIVLERMAELVRRALVRPKHRRRTKPSRAARQRRLDAKKHRAQTKALRRGSPH
jgi:ribosome-associated protein